MTLFLFLNSSISFAALARAEISLLNLFFLPKWYPKIICPAAIAPHKHPDDIPPENVVAQGNSSSGHKPASTYACIILSEQEYPFIKYYVVLAYFPSFGQKDLILDDDITIYPEGLEQVPLKFAINRRNEWMIKNLDFVIVYVNRGYGGAAKFKEKAEKQGKVVVNIFDIYK